MIGAVTRYRTQFFVSFMTYEWQEEKLVNYEKPRLGVINHK